MAPEGQVGATLCAEVNSNNSSNNNNNNNNDDDDNDNDTAAAAAAGRDSSGTALPAGGGKRTQLARPQQRDAAAAEPQSAGQPEMSKDQLVGQHHLDTSAHQATSQAPQGAPITPTQPEQPKQPTDTSGQLLPEGAHANQATAKQTKPPKVAAPNCNHFAAGHQQHQNHQQQQLEPFAAGQASAAPKPDPKRVGRLQGLLLRKWPYLALSICIMSCLLFGMLLTALTVVLMNSWGAGQCGLALSAGHHQQLQDSLPLDMALQFGASLGAPGESAAHGAAQQLRLLSGPPVASLDAELSGRSLGASGEHHPALGAAASAASQQQQQQHLGGPVGAQTQPVARFQRLPQALAPEHYELFIWPIIAAPAFNFSGQVAIQIRCHEPTDNITLHSLDLDIEQASILLELLAQPEPGALGATNQSAPRVKRLSQDKQLQYSIVHLEAPLQAGRHYRLSLDFAGPLNDDLAGFYKIKYEPQDSSEPTWIAATQFQATDARRAFPCFDEPMHKATFSIKIKHWKNMTALSNMPIINSEESQDGLWITDTFAKTHRMSTYLVAFAVTNFESRSNGNISVWTRPGFAHTAEYALKVAERILRHYENFFGIEYPLPKMDMIALPDFNAGAMENWGLITYRETAMLFDESSSSVLNKQRVATVVAHELAHQWFGNLVTPKWWDDLWLNEGFASYVEYIGVDHVEPHWRMLDQFVVDEIQDVLKVDCLSSSHQISIPVNNPDEISEIFDHISYSKGASIIRMMNHFLTEEVFKLGLQRYLKALKYNNAEQKDLWAHLMDAQRIRSNSSSKISDLSAIEAVNVESVMNSWTLQTGFPLVTLTRNYDNVSVSKATLDQVRFQPLYVAQSRESSNSNATNLQQSAMKQMKWEIPITYTWKSDKNWNPITRLWLHQNATYPVELTKNGGHQMDQPLSIPDNDWILLNVKQVGYYRVNYDQRNWQLLIEQLQQDHSQIPTINRAQILDDLFDLAKSSMLDYRFPLEATRYLKSERDYLPWRSVLISFSYIDDMLRRTPIYGEWNDYVSKVIEPFYNRYKDLDWTIKDLTKQSRLKRQLLSLTGTVNKTTTTQVASPQTPTMDSNDVLEQYNQMNAITWACQVNQHCIGKAKKIFREWRDSKQNRIIPALRYATYCAAIENGNKDDWEFLWRVYEKEQNASEKDRILKALGCSKEIWILSRYIEWIFDKTKPIRRQDGSYVFRTIAGNNYGRDVAFNFMREKWPTIKEYYGKSSFSMSVLVRSVSTTMNTNVELGELRNFYESIKSDVGNGKRSFQLAIEEVEGNVYWRNNNYKKLEEWLLSENKSHKSASNQIAS